MYDIPLIHLERQFNFLKPRIMQELDTVISGGQYILGPRVEALEKKMAEMLKVSQAVAVANGTDALVLALKAFGIGKGDEVITTPFTFFATAEAIVRVGAIPVFVDISAGSYNIDPAKIAEKITSHTRAIIPVHLFGQPADMDEIMAVANQYGLIVIEDACQAFGADYKGKQVGSIGHAACFSFFPTKNLGTLGDGGLITTSREDIAQKVRILRQHGSIRKYEHECIGYNSRLDEIHAAILLVALAHIGEWNERRRELAMRYRQGLQNVQGIHIAEETDDRTHIYHLFCLECAHRENKARILQDNGIQTGVYYPQPMHKQKALAGIVQQTDSFPVAEKMAQCLLAIPMSPFLQEEEQDRVIRFLRDESIT